MAAAPGGSSEMRVGKRRTDLASQGLYLDLPEYGAQLFHFEPMP
jgi:hypothetical protein